MYNIDSANYELAAQPTLCRYVHIGLRANERGDFFENFSHMVDFMYNRLHSL